jgi:hypothetical protein
VCVSGGRTPGEEYCDIAPVTSEGRPVSNQRRSAFVALHVVLPYLFKRLRKNGRRVTIAPESNGSYSFGVEIQLYYIQLFDAFPVAVRASGWLWNHIVSLALKSDSALTVARRWHLALFYLVGAYLEISRRSLGLRYMYAFDCVCIIWFCRFEKILLILSVIFVGWINRVRAIICWVC